MSKYRHSAKWNTDHPDFELKDVSSLKDFLEKIEVSEDEFKEIICAIRNTYQSLKKFGSGHYLFNLRRSQIFNLFDFLDLDYCSETVYMFGLERGSIKKNHAHINLLRNEIQEFEEKIKEDNNQQSKGANT